MRPDPDVETPYPWTEIEPVCPACGGAGRDHNLDLTCDLDPEKTPSRPRAITQEPDRTEDSA